MPLDDVEIKFGIDIDNATTNLGTLRKDWQKVLQDMGKSPSEIRAFMQLARDANEGKVAIDGLDNETQQLLKTYQSLSTVAKGREALNLIPHKNIEQEIQKARLAYDDLRKSGQLTGTELAQAHLKMQQKVADLEHQTNGWASALNEVKYNLAGVAAGAAGLVSASQQAIQFETAIADVAKVVDATDAEIEKLADDLKRMAPELGISADGLAAIAAQAGQLGIASGEITQFTELAAKMATAFNLLPEQAGDAIAKIKNIFQLPISDIESLGDAINTLGNNTAARESDIVDAMTRIGGTARQFGLVAEEAAALSAAFIALGKPPEVAGTAINALLSKLQTAEVGSKSFKEGLDSLGISAQELASDIQEHPQKALIEFLKTLENLDNKSRAETLTKLFGAEYQDDISILIGSLGEYEKSLGLVVDRQSTAGAMEKEFQTRMQTTEAQLARLGAAVETIAINLGTIFLPAIAAVASGLADAASAVAEFVEAYPAISGAAAVVATLSVGISGLSVAFSALKVVGIKTFTQLTASASLFNKEVGRSEGAVGKLGAALSVISAASIGWEIGTYLREEFEIARKAGVLMVEGLVKGFEYLQYGWESFEAAFTDDTIDEAAARHEQRLKQMDETFDQMYKEAEKVPAKIDDSQKAALDSIQKTQQAAAEGIQATHNEASKKIAETHEQAVARINEEIGTLSGTHGELSTQIEALETRLKSIPVAYESINNSVIATSAKQKSLIALSEHEAQLKKELIDLEIQRGNVQIKIAEQQTELQDVNNKQQKEKLNAAKKLLAEYKLDLDELQTGISANAKKAIESMGEAVKAVQNNVNDAGKQAAGVGEILRQALGDISNSTELQTLQNEWTRMHESGEITKDVWTSGMQQIKEKAGELNNSDPGQGTREIKEGAEQAKPALEKLKDGVKQVQQQTEEFGDSAKAVAGGVAGIINQTTQSMYGLSEAAGRAFESLQFDRSVLTGIDELKENWRNAREEADRYATAQLHLSSSSLGGYFADLYEKSARVKESFYAQRLELESLTEKIDRGSLSLRQLIYLQDNADRKFDLLDDNDLSGLRSAIQAARQELERMNEDADATIANLQDRLDELRNNEDAIRQRQYERDKAELEKELAEARAANNLDAIRKYEEALRLLRQIQQEEQVKAKQEAVETTTSNNKQSPDKIVQLQLGNERIDVKTDDPEALLRLLSDANLRSYTR